MKPNANYRCGEYILVARVLDGVCDRAVSALVTGVMYDGDLLKSRTVNEEQVDLTRHC